MVKDLEKLLRRLLPEGIDLNVTLGEDTTVMADVTQIDQVLINLGTNARDAMTRGGKLKIETGRVEIDAEFVRIHGLGAPGIYGVISASDTGTGMDEKVRQKIFEPFYTTKEEGKGTGLCLSIVYGIVKQHRGYIEAESEPGRGTMFKLYLPSGKTKAPRTKSRAIDWQKGTETILFADDNRDVRQTGAEILRIAGYSVIEASDGLDAVSKFIEHRGAVDLLVLDVVMPQKNGKETYEEIKRIDPATKAVFISGYTHDIVIGKGVDTPQYLSKPFDPTLLLKRVRETLDRKEQIVSQKLVSP